MTSNICHCNCSWPECDDLYSSVLSSLSEDHVWTGASVRIEFGTNSLQLLNIKKYVFLKAIQKHCVSFTTLGSSIKSNFYIRRHHFPMALLIYKNKIGMKQYLTFLGKKMVKDICAIEGRHRFQERSNSVVPLSMGIACPVVLEQYKDKFVQSPMSTTLEVSEEIKHHLNNRKRKRKYGDRMEGMTSITPKNNTIKKNVKLTPKRLCLPARRSHRIRGKNNDEDHSPKNPSISTQSERSKRSIRRSSLHITYDRNPSPVKQQPICTLSTKVIQSPEVVTSLSFATETLINKYKSFNNSKELFIQKISTISLVKVISLVHGNWDKIVLHDGNILFPCKNMVILRYFSFRW